MLVVLLPVRNGERELPGFFESVRRFADGVIALDDGSTDATGEILQNEPLITEVLHDPPRDSFAGWNDAANRNRLLAAAAAVNPDWVLSLDADERIDELDAKVLVSFIQTDALPGLAYGFRCFPVSDDGRWFLPNPIWIYRLFAYEPGVRFPDQRFHFAPIPTSIPREAWVRTSFRIQHLGGFDDARRTARYEKYRDVDPERRFWPSYSQLLAPVNDELLLPWQPRRPDEPVLLVDAPDTSEPTPAGSAPSGRRGVLIVHDSARPWLTERTLIAIQPAVREETEVIVVGAQLPADLPARSVEVAPGTPRGAQLRAALAAAEANLLALLDAGQIPDPAFLPSLWSTLDNRFAIVRSTVTAPRGDAHSARQHRLRHAWPDPAGEGGSWRPAGFRRDFLAQFGDDLLDPGMEHDPELLILRAAARNGLLVGRIDALLTDRPDPVERPASRLTRQVHRGADWARADLRQAGPQPAPVTRRLGTFAATLKDPAQPSPRVDIAALAAGYLVGLIGAAPGDGWKLIGRPALTVGFASAGAEVGDRFELARLDLAAGSARVLTLPATPAAVLAAHPESAGVHALRDRFELACGVGVDEVLIWHDQGREPGFTSFARWLASAPLIEHAPALRQHLATTIPSRQLLLVLARIAQLANQITAVSGVATEESALTAALQQALAIPDPRTLRERLRTVTWA